MADQPLFTDDAQDKTPKELKEQEELTPVSQEWVQDATEAFAEVASMDHKEAEGDEKKEDPLKEHVKNFFKAPLGPNAVDVKQAEEKKSTDQSGPADEVMIGEGITLSPMEDNSSDTISEPLPETSVESIETSQETSEEKQTTPFPSMEDILPVQEETPQEVVTVVDSEPIQEETLDTVSPFLEEEQGIEEPQSTLSDFKVLAHAFAEIDPQKALETREWSDKELAELEAEFHAFVENARLSTVNVEDQDEEFAAFCALSKARKALEKVEFEHQDTDTVIQQMNDDFFLFYGAQPLRYIFEYFAGICAKQGQVVYYPYIDYKLMAKRPFLVGMLFQSLFSILPTENSAFMLTVRDEIYADRKKYVRFTMECSSHSKTSKGYIELKPLLVSLLETMRGRFAMRELEHTMHIVIDFPFVVKKEES